jgi:hypothetical protein
MNQINVDKLQSLPSAFRGGKVAVTIGRKRDPVAVGRPSGAEVAAAVTRSERLGLESRWVKYPEIRGPRTTRRYEGDLSSVRGEGGLIVVSRIIGQALQVAAVWMHAVEISGSGPLRRERDPIALGRPGRIVIE